VGLGSGEVPVCRCGREAEPPHCTRCGSANVYILKRAARRIRVGTEVYTVRQFSCRRCGQQFGEDQPCAAPVLLVGVKAAHPPSELKAEEARLREEGFRGQSLTEFQTKFLEELSKINPSVRAKLQADKESLAEMQAKRSGASHSSSAESDEERLLREMEQRRSRGEDEFFKR
jgi:hypothetical protein